MIYTLAAAMSAVVTLVLDLFILRTKTVRTRHFARLIGFMTLGRSIENGFIPLIDYHRGRGNFGFLFMVPIRYFPGHTTPAKASSD